MIANSLLSLVQNIVEDESDSREYFLKQILEAIPGAFYICDASGYISYYNNEAVTLWGREPVCGKDLWCGSWKIYNSQEEQIDLATCPMATLIQLGKLEQVEEIIIERPDGSRRHVLPHPRILKNTYGKIVGAFNMLVDITERKKALEWNRASDQFMQRILASSNDGIILLDLEGNIQSINEGGMALIEADQLQPILGSNYISLWKNKHQQDVLTAIQSAKQGIPGQFSGSFYTLKTHTLKWCHVIINTINDRQGKPERLLAIERDITDHKLLEEELNTRNESLQQLNKSLEDKNFQLQKTNIDLDNFIYTISHDLKAPVSNIEGLLYILSKNLKSECPSIEEQMVVLQLMQSSISRFSNSISELTKIIKAGKDMEKDELEDVNIIELIEDIKDANQELIQESNAKIITEFLTLEKIKFSRKNLKSILYNLISNAIKYKSNERDPEILITAEKNDEYIIIKVKDNGLGIDEKKQRKLFTLFKRFHSHVEGTGIGLYLVKRIITNAGGKIEVESLPEIGSTFKIYLKI